MIEMKAERAERIARVDEEVHEDLPEAEGQTSWLVPYSLGTVAGSSVTLPVAPSIACTAFCRTVGRAHRNFPVARCARSSSP